MSYFGSSVNQLAIIRLQVSISQLHVAAHGAPISQHSLLTSHGPGANLIVKCTRPVRHSQSYVGSFCHCSLLQSHFNEVSLSHWFPRSFLVFRNPLFLIMLAALLLDLFTMNANGQHLSRHNREHWELLQFCPFKVQSLNWSVL